MNSPIRLVRLASGPHESGLYCGPKGLTLAGFPLMKQTTTGFAAKSPSELQNIFDVAYGENAGMDASQYAQGLTNVAHSLNKGDLPLAMISSLMLRLPDLPQPESRFAKVSGSEAKRAYDEDQPRDADGRWTQGPGEALQTPQPAPPAITPPPLLETTVTTAAERAVSRLAEIGPRMLALIGELGLVIADAVPLALGFTLIPLNRSNVHGGDFPGFPNLHYVSDEGSLTITRNDAAGTIETLYRSLPDANNFYRDLQGTIIGRLVGTSVLFDDDMLAEMADPSKTKLPDTGTVRLPGTSTGQDDDEPRVCPPPTPENIKGRSLRSLAYQKQITGLPNGFDVELNGVRFDGCDPPTQDMEEAKGLMADYITGMTEEELLESWFYVKITKQAGKQSIAAGDRRVDWYFADEHLAEFFTRDFEKFPNLIVHYEEAIVKKFEYFLDVFQFDVNVGSSYEINEKTRTSY